MKKEMRLLTRDEVAEKIGCSVWRVDTLRKKGILDCYIKAGKRYMFFEKGIEIFIRKNQGVDFSKVLKEVSKNER
ncbi:hypothetical protein [Faecalibacillus intestinalis]|uniref:hypothetical protein n=1 Tax=Faecalibacillus intestinalis TaxID=1982626 RepID=UPI0018AA8AED|nr:hypothetical protein [Faecalibacillus intestinalis]